MRKSVIQGDPGYDPDAWRYRVFLDGVEIFNCHTADDDKGIVYCYQHCDISESCSGVKTVKRLGVVRLEKTDNAYFR